MSTTAKTSTTIITALDLLGPATSAAAPDDGQLLFGALLQPTLAADSADASIVVTSESSAGGSNSHSGHQGASRNRLQDAAPQRKDPGSTEAELTPTDELIIESLAGLGAIVSGPE